MTFHDEKSFRISYAIMIKNIHHNLNGSLIAASWIV